MRRATLERDRREVRAWVDIRIKRIVINGMDNIVARKKKAISSAENPSGL